MNIPNLMMHYAKANLELDGIYRINVLPGSKVYDKTTLEGVCVFVIPIRGKAKYTIEKEEYLLEPGTILHAGSRMALSKEVFGDTEWEYILLHYKVLQEEQQLPSLLTMHYSLKIHLEQKTVLMQLFEQLLFLYKQPGMHQLLQTKCYLYEMLVILFQDVTKCETRKCEDKMDEVLHFIHVNLGETINIEELSRLFHYKPKQFSYQFRKKTGMSPKKYIMQIHLKKAKELLIESNLSISEIARCIGYDDALHFSRIFKRYIGISPSHFRNEFEKSPY